MDIFDEFVIVEQKAFTDLKIGGTHFCINHTGFDYDCVECLNVSKKNVSTFSDVTHFAALEFQIDNNDQKLTIVDIGGTVCADVLTIPLAQIIRWEWNETDNEQVIHETQILDIGGKLEFDHLKHLSSFFIRILRKRENIDQPPFSPLSLSADNLTVQISGKQITTSAYWLMSQSPVIDRMLNVEMKEKKQRLITLDELDINMEQFKEFLEAISPIALQTSILPNPKNVLMLLKLADYFQVEWLKKRCEMHLINCVEIPLIDRFLLIEKYGLNNLKANRANLLPAISKEFMGQLINRIC